MQEPDADAIEMAAHYESGVEQSRLATWGRLEFIRTMEILQRHVPSPPAVIVDIGGGPGAYALRLAEEGHHVHLLDPMGLHVEQARLASRAQTGQHSKKMRSTAGRYEPTVELVEEVVQIRVAACFLRRSHHLRLVMLTFYGNPYEPKEIFATTLRHRVAFLKRLAR